MYRVRLAHELDVLTAICTQIKNGERGRRRGGGREKTSLQVGVQSLSKPDGHVAAGTFF